MTTTSYDTPTARAMAASTLAAGWRDPDGPIGRWKGWAWTPHADAADACARRAATALVRGEVERAHEWADAYQLLRDRVRRGHAEYERRRHPS